MDSMEVIKIMPPGPGTCRVCAAMHAPGLPHDRDSLYYQNWFHKRNGRFPTWSDAMSHCSESTRRRFIEVLARSGITVEAEGGSDG